MTRAPGPASRDAGAHGLLAQRRPQKAFAFAGITLGWEGEGVDEIGRCTKTGKTLVRVDPRYFRPAEVELLLGDPTKAKKLLGWQPTVTFEGLVEMMTKTDLDLAAAEAGSRTQN